MAPENCNYGPLDIEGQFRLLHLHPRKDWQISDAFQDVIITGHLELANLSDPNLASNETISYAWGDAAQGEFILLDGGFVDVPRNTYHALRAINMQNESRTVWIDAICINQQDLDERTSQVAKMSAIYRNGQRNLLYLGEGGELTDRAMTNMRAIARRCFIDCGPQKYHVQLLSGTPADVHIDTDALVVLFGEPVFRYAAVIQDLTGMIG